MPAQKEIIALLNSYSLKKRQIDQLRYELDHPPRVSEQDLLECLTLSGPVLGGGQGAGRVSDKTMTVALQYRDIAQRMNSEAALQIGRELQALVAETDRVEHYISLLSERQALVIRRYYFERKPWSDIEAELHVSKGTLNLERNRAVDTLASMYRFIADVGGNDSGQ